MNNSLVCVDASVVVDRLIALDDARLAALWTQWIDNKTHLVAPLLIRYEVVNVLYQIAKRSPLSLETIIDTIQVFNRLPLQLYSDPELHSKAFAIARELALGATYDAHYLALAAQLDCVLWTRDAKLARAAQAKYTWVRLLEYA